MDLHQEKKLWDLNYTHREGHTCLVWTFSVKFTKRAVLGKVRIITFSFIFTPVLFKYITVSFASILFTVKFSLTEVKNLFTLMRWGERMFTVQAYNSPPSFWHQQGIEGRIPFTAPQGLRSKAAATWWTLVTLHRLSTGWRGGGWRLQHIRFCTLPHNYAQMVHKIWNDLYFGPYFYTLIYFNLSFVHILYIFSCCLILLRTALLIFVVKLIHICSLAFVAQPITNISSICGP